MTRRGHMPAALLAAVLLTACGGSGAAPTPTVSPPATPDLPLGAQCFATKAYALEHLVAVIGVDRFPTALDAINTGGCSFSLPITQFTVQIKGEGHTQRINVVYSVPTDEIAFPLPPELVAQLLDPILPPGRYERTVLASTAAPGTEVFLSGFEPVILVRDPDSVTAQLLRAQSRWERNGASSYSYQASWSCFCVQEYVALVDVTVVSGSVTQVSFAEPGFAGEVPEPERFGPVWELFEFLQNAIALDAARIGATFHPELGYPVEVLVDYDARIADEETGFTVRSLAAT